MQQDDSRTETHKANIRGYSDSGAQRVNKHIPGIKGHISRESVCSCFAKEEAYAAVEAVCVRAGR